MRRHAQTLSELSSSLVAKVLALSRRRSIEGRPEVRSERGFARNFTPKRSAKARLRAKFGANAEVPERCKIGFAAKAAPAAPVFVQIRPLGAEAHRTTGRPLAPSPCSTSYRSPLNDPQKRHPR